MWINGRTKIAELSEKTSNEKLETTRTEVAEEIAATGATTRREETIISHEAATPRGEKIV
jgi:hypothetical protein